MPTGVFLIISFQYLYRLLLHISIVKWNLIERVVLNLTGRDDQTVNDYFYVLFVFYLRLAGFTYLSRLPEVDNIFVLLQFIFQQLTTMHW